MISEVDLNDWETTGNPVKLYDLSRGKKLVKTTAGYTCWFHHVDGMYSYCTTLENAVVHLAAWTEVYLLKEKDQHETAT